MGRTSENKEEVWKGGKQGGVKLSVVVKGSTWKHGANPQAPLGVLLPHHKLGRALGRCLLAPEQHKEAGLGLALDGAFSLQSS